MKPPQRKFYPNIIRMAYEDFSWCAFLNISRIISADQGDHSSFFIVFHDYQHRQEWSGAMMISLST